MSSRWGRQGEGRGGVGARCMSCRWSQVGSLGEAGGKGRLLVRVVRAGAGVKVCEQPGAADVGSRGTAWGCRQGSCWGYGAWEDSPWAGVEAREEQARELRASMRVGCNRIVACT